MPPPPPPPLRVSSCSLRAQLDDDIHHWLNEAVGGEQELATLDLLLARCHARLGLADPLALKAKSKAIAGAAFLLNSLELGEAKERDIAIMETSRISGMQHKLNSLVFGSPRSQNAFELDYHVRKKLSCDALGAPADEGGRVESVNGKLCQAFTRQLLRLVREAVVQRPLARPLASLALADMKAAVEELWQHNGGASRLQSTATAFAGWLAHYHDSGAHNPLIGTRAEGVFEFNKWAEFNCKRAMVDPLSTEILDFCCVFSIRGRSETADMASFLGMPVAASCPFR